MNQLPPTTTQPILAEITRTHRKKTIKISVKDGKVLVFAPKHTTDAEIQSLLSRKNRWIERALELDKQRPLETFALVNDASIFFMGEKYTLSIEQNDTTGIFISTNGKLTIKLPKQKNEPHYIRLFLKQWYVERAEQYLLKQTAFFQETIGVKPNQIKVGLRKSRWGSCSSSGNINLNWLLIMAPPEVINYVIVHELCHLIELNHSKAFWQLVATHYPNYKTCQKWLKSNGELLMSTHAVWASK